jgi:hypothetical protein
MTSKRNSQRSGVNHLCAIQKPNQEQATSVVGDTPATVTRKINPKLMQLFDEQSEQPEPCFVAVQKCMLVIAQLRSHDPLLIQKATHYPLDFARAVIWFLLGNECWISWQGYVGLLCSLEEYPENTDVLDECQDICDQMWTDPSRRVVDCEWKKHR